MTKALFLASAASVLILAATSQAATPPAPSPDDTFKALYTTEWTWRLQQSDSPDEKAPSQISPHLPDVSGSAQATQLAYWQEVQAKLKAIDPATLTPADQVNYAVYKEQIDTLVAAQVFREYEKPFNSDSSFWGDMTYLADSQLHTELDYRNYLSQLSDVPRYFAQNIDNMRAGEKRGFTPPRVTLENHDASIKNFIDIKRPEDSVYYKPFVAMPANIPVDVQAKLRAQAVKVITDDIIPAHKTLLAFIDDEYVPDAVTSLAATDQPEGPAYYQSKIKEFTTLDLTPDQIHQIGLEQVALIHAQMLDIMKEVHFKGTFPAFLKFLRTSPKFYVKTPQALLDRAAWIAKTFDGKASTWFGHMPRSRFGIVPVPAAIAPFYTAGRGGPGQYLLNTYDLKSRPLFQLTALTLHESAPGHGWQIPLASENKDLPDFRQNSYISAYGEGWAVYCEKLGVDMGMYDTPYDRFGELSYQMWRAARLVVDTGIHSQHWTREQARAYLRENTALSEHEIDTEVDRYISWPGQALSYYLGEMTIEQVRTKAEKALGQKFNIRAFHDSVLALGSVPLPVVTARIDQFIADGGVGPYPDEEK